MLQFAHLLHLSKLIVLNLHFREVFLSPLPSALGSPLFSLVVGVIGGNKKVSKGTEGKEKSLRKPQHG